MFQDASKIVTRGILAAAMMLPLLACNKGDPDSGRSPETPASDTPAKSTVKLAGGSGPNAKLAQKLNEYVDCFNAVDGDARGSADRYTSWIGDLDKGPTGNERSVNVLGDLRSSDLDRCTQSIEAALKAEPSLPALDAAAKRYLETLTVLVPLTSQAHAYYDHGDYKDDGFAKGKQMHMPLMMAFGRFIYASDAYNAEIEKESDALTVSELAGIEASQGRHAAYYRLALVSKGKALAKQLNEKKPDIAGITTSVDAYGALVDESRKATAGPSEAPIGWSPFQTTAEKFLKDSKDRMRRIRDNTPYSQGDQMLMEGSPGGAWMVEGSPDRIFKSYNDLVDASNRL